MSRRVEMRVSEALLARIDEVRRDTPRGTWVKQVIREALESAPRYPSADRRDDSGLKGSVPSRTPSVSQTWAR